MADTDIEVSNRQDGLGVRQSNDLPDVQTGERTRRWLCSFNAIMGMATVLYACPLFAPPSSAQSSPRLQYPAAHTTGAADTLHGVVIADPYRWLEDTSSAATHTWLAAELELTKRYLAAIPARAHIRALLHDWEKAQSCGVPWKRGGRYFFLCSGGGGGKAKLHWQSTLAETPRPLLDESTLSTDGSLRIKRLSFSHDGRLLAYGVSYRGADRTELRVRDVDTGTDLSERLLRADAVAWTHDGAGFFYSHASLDQGALGSLRPNQVRYHRLGTPQSDDLLVYERNEQPGWILIPRISDDGRYLVIRGVQGNVRGSRIDYLDLADPRRPRITGSSTPLFAQLDASYWFVGNEGSLFYIWTNNAAPRGRLITVDPAEPGPEHWTTVIPEAAEVLEPNKVIIVNRQIIVGYLIDAQRRLRRFALDGSPIGEIPLPHPGGVDFSYLARSQDDPELFYLHYSFLSPGTVYRFDFTTGHSTVVSTPSVDFDASQYTSQQVFYSSKDGTQIPMFLVHRKDLKLNGSNPTLLVGYGGFGISLTPDFSASQAVWLQLGGILAVANLRGGGEYGEEWHRAAIQDRKQTTFEDFIAAAEYLIRGRYTKPAKLAINGVSWGSTMVQVVMNQRPDLFGAVIPERASGDLLRHLDPIIVPELGSLDDPRMFQAIRAYSPQHNVRAGTCYPATLVMNGAHDDRGLQGPGPGFKYVATLQRAQACAKPVLLRVDRNAGHGSGGIEEDADRLSFLVAVLGLRQQ